MAILSIITLRGSVGRRGVNQANDVRAIQTRLNELMRPPRRFLNVDGRSGPMTEAAIADFQRVVRGSANPDCRVDPGQQTLKALNDPASATKWAQGGISAAPAVTAGAAAGASGAAGSYPRAASAAEKAVIDAARKSAEAAKKAGDPVPFELLRLMLEDDTYTQLKSLFNGAGAMHWASEFALSIQGLTRVGFRASEIRIIFLEFNKNKKYGGLAKLLEEFRKQPGLAGVIGKVLKGGGTLLNGIGIVFTAMEVTDHLQMKRYGPAAAEVYSSVMGTLIPWAGLVAGLQEIVYAHSPALKGQGAVNYFFRFLNVLDPIGLGKIWADSYVTILATILTSFQRGQIDLRQMEALVERMRKTPASDLVKAGEWMGDRAFDATTMGKNFFDKLVGFLRS